MEEIKIADKGFLRKLGLTLSIACTGIMMWNAISAGSTWPGYLYAVGLGFSVFLLTRFRSEIIISANEFRFVGKVWIKIRDTRIPIIAIEKIVGTQEGREKQRYIAILYNCGGKKKKLKLFADEFPELRTIFKTIANTNGIRFEELAP